jgi:GTP-binding protein
VFIDEAVIEVRGGKGGDGAVTLHREKFAPKGGPDGGDGGRGGDVIAIADAHLRTLVDFTSRAHFHATDGGRGGANRRRGKNGEDLEIRLPVGVVIYAAAAAGRPREDGAGRRLSLADDPDQPVLVDLSEPGKRVVLARGGRGGRGNARFATPTRQTPRFAEKGEPAETLRLALELKLLADVGVIGLPNVGKSSLIARVSAARPKIADYPFTTLVPNLGVVRIDEETSFVIADLPGLVEGAHAGAGRGHQFLRHAERTHLLVHMLDMAAERDPRDDFIVVNRELALHGQRLAQRPQLVALNKMDLNPSAEKVADTEAFLSDRGFPSFRISAATGAGVEALVKRAAQLLDDLAAAAGPITAPVPPASRPALSEAEAPKAPLRVTKLDQGIYQVSGEQVERALVMTDLGNEEAVRYLHRRLQRMGIIRRLRALGARDGDRVRIGSVELEFVE